MFIYLLLFLYPKKTRMKQHGGSFTIIDTDRENEASQPEYSLSM